MKKTISILVALLLMLTLSEGLFAFAADTSTGTTLRLVKAEGSVTVTNKNGKTLKFTENMKLYNAYSVTTSAKSYAYISLDDAKAIKLDAGTQVEIRKSGKKLEVNLVSGKVFCNVTVPLKKDEDLNITTSTTITGIRGTSLCVSESAGNTEIQVYSGHVVTAVYNALNRLTGEHDIKPGEQLTAAISGGTAGIEMSKLSINDVPGFIAVLIENNQDIRENMERIGIDVDKLINEAQTLLKNEQDAKGELDVYHPSGSNTPSPSPSSENNKEESSGGSSNSGRNDRDESSGGSANSSGNNNSGNSGGSPNTGENDNDHPPVDIDDSFVYFDVSAYSSPSNTVTELQNLLNSSDATHTSIRLTGIINSMLYANLTIPAGKTLETNGVILELTGNLTINGTMNITKNSVVDIEGDVIVDDNGALNVIAGGLDILGDADGTLNLAPNGFATIAGTDFDFVTGEYEVGAYDTSLRFFHGSWDALTEFVNYAGDLTYVNLKRDVNPAKFLFSIHEICFSGEGHTVNYMGENAAYAAINAPILTVSNCVVVANGKYQAVLRAESSLDIFNCTITANTSGTGNETNKSALYSSGSLSVSNSNVYAYGDINAIMKGDSGVSNVDDYSNIYVHKGFVVKQDHTTAPAEVRFSNDQSVFTKNASSTIATLFDGCTDDDISNYVKFLSTVIDVKVADTLGSNSYYQVTLIAP